jgi:3-isopropylmalate/(R)-2-methylmalate dehydratase large subunit
MSKPTTLYDKIWNDHLVHEAEDGTYLPLYRPPSGTR